MKTIRFKKKIIIKRHISVNEFLRESVFSRETFPALDLTINAARRPTFYYWNAFFLIFLITLTSLSIFSIKCHMNHSRIQTTSKFLSYNFLIKIFFIKNIVRYIVVNIGNF